MKGITAELSASYLQAVAELRSACPLYDTHVHPYEVLFDRFAYRAEPSLAGVLSLPGKSYHPPSPSAVKFAEVPDPGPEPLPQRLIEVATMLLGRMYGSVGARVFADQMSLAGLDRVLLLPVASESSEPEQFELRMQWVSELYGKDDRFWLAGSIPPKIDGADIDRYAARLKERFAIRAIKCHPVVSGIDLATSSRKSWLETLLESCHRLRLPLVLHGGRNNPYFRGARGDFGSLRHLRQIDFSLSRYPVVLAHAGVHRIPVREMESDALPLLKKMLARHDNLYVDLSGLEFEQIGLVLASVAPERILFGSDALYTPQWQMVASTVHALHCLGAHWEERFLQFAGLNPQQLFAHDLPFQAAQRSGHAPIDTCGAVSPASPPLSLA